MQWNSSKLLRASALAAFAGALGACAQTSASGPAMLAGADARQCFFADSVSGFSAVSDRVVNVGVGANDVYRLELFAPCPDVDWAQRIALISHGSSWICSGLDATVVAPSTIGPQRCAVRSVRKLPPAQVAALPPSQRP